jgi:hypothetical protein
MATVIRQTIDPANSRPTDERERVQGVTLNGTIIDPVSCSPAMLIGEIVPPSTPARALRSAASARRQRQCHGGGAQRQDVRSQCQANQRRAPARSER